MSIKSSNHFGPRLTGWTPSPEAQMVIFWRIMHLYMSRYGSIPLGQMLVELTTVVLNELVTTDSDRSLRSEWPAEVVDLPLYFGANDTRHGR